MKKILSIGIIISAIVPGIAFAQTTNTTAVPAGQSEFSSTPSTPPNYTLLAPLPCVGATTGSTCTSTNGGASLITSIGIQGYLLYLFKLIIALAVFLAVIMTIFGGFKYMTVESVTGKSDARKTIENAALGLLLALSSYLILYTINPDLVNLTKVALPKLNVSASSNVQNSVNQLDNSVQAINSSARAAIGQTSTAAVAAQANEADDNDALQNVQDQMSACNSGDVSCTPEQYQDLQNQLTTDQQNVTTDKNQSTAQVGVGDMNSAVVSATSLVSAGPNGTLQANTQGGDVLSNVDGDINTMTDTYNTDMQSLGNDVADKQTLTNQYQYSSATLNDEQTLLQYQSGQITADQANANIQQENSIMQNEQNTSLQGTYNTFSTQVQASLTSQQQQTQSTINAMPPVP